MATTTTIKEFVSELTPDITGEEIREARTVLDLTPEVMAQALGVDVAVLSQWESGELSPEAPGAVKYSIEYFKLCDTLLNDEVFSTLEDRIEEMTQLREKLDRDRVANRALLDKYAAQLT